MLQRHQENTDRRLCDEQNCDTNDLVAFENEISLSLKQLWCIQIVN